MQPSEEIKQKLDIVDVLKDYIRLNPAGMNFRASCPFHKEKTPSFMVSPDKQIWHCFGCGKSGDIFSFIMEMEGVDFREALRILAPKAGVTLRQMDPKQQSRRNRIMDILDWSRRYYHEQLLNSPQAAKAREYLKKRGLGAEVIEEWQIGYSPDSWDAVLNFLRSKGYKDSEILSAGMTVKSNNSSRHYDRFRGRIMFPLKDVNGNTVAFSARVSPEKEAAEKMGKYINSPQTEVYDKSRLLFGLDKAKMDIKKQDQAIIVEGQMDAISAQSAGWKNTVASSGTALTAEQIQLLKRYSNNIALAFDRDSAGLAAADRGIRTAMQSEMNIRIIELPEGMDPDDCLKKDPAAWDKAVKNAKSMMQYSFDRVLGGLDLSGPEGKRQAAAKLLPTVVGLGNRIEQDYWLKYLAQALEVEENLLREATSGQKTSAYRPDQKDREKTAPKRLPQKQEAAMSELILALALKFPDLVGFIIDNLVIEYLAGESSQYLYKKIIIYYNNSSRKNIKNGESVDYAGFDYQNFFACLKEKNNNEDIEKASAQINFLNRLVFLGEESYTELDYDQAKQEVRRIIIFLKKIYLKKQIKKIENMIAAAEKSGENEEINRLMEELKILTDEIRELGL